MKKSCLLIFGISLCISQTIAESLDYKGLFSDLKEYKKIKGECHAGHLYEHMVWVAKAVDRMFEQKSKWIEEISPEDRRLMVIAGFMHDIGKAGDGAYFYTVKPTHPRVGFEYLMGTRSYTMKNGSEYNFHEWCKQMNLSVDDTKTLAV